LASNAFSAVGTFLRSMKANWHFGGATWTRDPQAAIRGYERALNALCPDRVDVQAPWCRSIIPFALVGYCDAAQRLGRADDAAAALARWRPVYLPWLREPLTEDARKAYAWLEAQL
jgi:hypothetical protein